MKKNKKVKAKKRWFARLLDMNDDTVSMSSVFLIVCACIALALLLVPVVGMCYDIHYNHTITMDMGAMAEYIGASCTSLICGVLQKGWTNYSSYKFRGKKHVEKIKDVVDDVIEDNEGDDADKTSE